MPALTPVRHHRRAIGEATLRTGRHGVYVTTLLVGTPPQAIDAVIDTGSVALVIEGAGTAGGSAYGHHTPFDPSRSTSAQTLGGDLDLEYGSGHGTASRLRDLAGPVGIGRVPVELALLSDAQHIGSILGLGPSCALGPGDPPLRSWLDVAAQAGLVADRVTLTLTVEGAPGSGVGFGTEVADEPAACFVALLAADDYTVADVAIGSGADLLGRLPEAVLDSGTTVLALPGDVQVAVASAMARGAAAAGLSLPDGFWSGDLETVTTARLTHAQVDALPPLWVTLTRSVRLSISPRSYLRHADDGGWFFAVKARSDASVAPLLGQVLLEGRTTIFDRGGGRVGFVEPIDISRQEGAHS